MQSFDPWLGPLKSQQEIPDEPELGPVVMIELLSKLPPPEGGGGQDDLPAVRKEARQRAASRARVFTTPNLPPNTGYDGDFKRMPGQHLQGVLSLANPWHNLDQRIAFAGQPNSAIDAQPVKDPDADKPAMRTYHLTCPDPGQHDDSATGEGVCRSLLPDKILQTVAGPNSPGYLQVTTAEVEQLVDGLSGSFEEMRRTFQESRLSKSAADMRRSPASLFTVHAQKGREGGLPTFDVDISSVAPGQDGTTNTVCSAPAPAAPAPTAQSPWRSALVQPPEGLSSTEEAFWTSPHRLLLGSQSLSDLQSEPVVEVFRTCVNNIQDKIRTTLFGSGQQLHLTEKHVSNTCSILLDFPAPVPAPGSAPPTILVQDCREQLSASSGQQASASSAIEIEEADNGAWLKFLGKPKSGVVGKQGRPAGGKKGKGKQPSASTEGKDAGASSSRFMLRLLCHTLVLHARLRATRTPACYMRM